jgi:hypothetical protein
MGPCARAVDLYVDLFLCMNPNQSISLLKLVRLRPPRHPVIPDTFNVSTPTRERCRYDNREDVDRYRALALFSVAARGRPCLPFEFVRMVESR